MRRSFALFALAGLVGGLGIAVAGTGQPATHAQSPQRVVVYESFMRGV